MNINKNVFIDVGYTNIKILDDNEIIIHPVKKCIKLIKNISKKSYCFIACNNQKYLKNILKIKNSYLITWNDFVNDIKIGDEFKIEELGIDLILYCYWLKQNKINDAIVLSSGTCSVLMVIKNSELISVQISSGFELELNSIEKIIKGINKKFSETFHHFNTEKAIYISYINKIKGMIEINKQNFNIDKNVYLT
ncbi:MAG: hypothetical protein K2I49_02670, partial [Ureaplasma sp.]|nr:hypothetical protein [Ureaplasma sp.]